MATKVSSLEGLTSVGAPSAFDPGAHEFDAISELIGRIYECAIDPGQWNDTLDHLIGLLAPPEWEVALLVLQRRSPPAGSLVGAAGLMPVAREIYLSTFAAENPWTRRFSRQALGRVFEADEVMPRSELLESAFYKNFLSTWDMQCAVAVLLDRDENEVLGLIVPGRPGRDLGTLKRGLRLLAPHLQRAMRISHALGESNLRAGAAEAALENAMNAIVTLTPERRIIHANGKAVEFAKAGGIKIAGGIFAFQDRKSQARLLELAAAAPPSSAAFKIPNPQGADLAVLCSRLPTQVIQTLTGQLAGAAILVSIGHGHVRAPLIEINRLAAWFGFTPAEARLAGALASGKSLQSLAEERNVSLNAVRFLLKGVYRKTGATTQAQLVAIVRDLPTG